MTSFVSGSRFGRQAALRIGILIALTLGFPFIVYGLIVATGARSIGGASGALAVVAGVYLKPVIAGAFVLSMILPCWRRMRSLGMPSWWGLIVPLLFLMDGAALILIGAHWGVAFSLGVLHLSAPLYAMTALVFVVVMGLAEPPADDEPPGLARFGRVGTITAILALCVIAIALMSSALGWWATSLVWKMPKAIPPYVRTIFKASQWLGMVKPYACFALCGALVWLAFLSRRHGRDDTPASAPVGNSGSSPALPVSGSSRAVFGKR